MTFKRALGPFDATMVVIGGIIGSGIFINPYIVAQRLDSAGLVLAAWAAGGAIALAGAFAYAELGAIFPRAGGQYVYLRDAYHPLAGFLYGWALLALIESGAIAAVAIAFANYALRLAGRPDVAPAPLAIAAVVLLSLVNYLGVKPGSRVLNVLVVLKVAALAVLIGFGAFAPAHAGWWTAARETSAPPLTTVVAFGAALVPILFAYGGWQNANYVAEEIENPRRNLPLSLIAGTIAVVVIYVLVNIVYLRALGLEGLAATTTPASDAAERMFGALGDRFVTAAIAISTFGFLDLAILAPTRVYYAMAADGVFFPALANLHPTYRTPGLAIVLQSAWSCVLALSGTYGQLAELRRLCRLDFLRPDGRDRAGVPPDVSTRAASAGFVPRARVSRCADRVRRRCGSRRAERRLGRSGRRAARHAPARRRHPRLLLVQPPHTMTTLRFHAPYMEWAKARPSPRFDLASSNILPCSIDELTGARDAIALTGHNENGYAPLVECDRRPLRRSPCTGHDRAGRVGRELPGVRRAARAGRRRAGRAARLRSAARRAPAARRACRAVRSRSGELRARSRRRAAGDDAAHAPHHRHQPPQPHRRRRGRRRAG